MDLTTSERDKRDDFAFTWYVSCGMSLYAALAGVEFDLLFRDADAIARAYTVGEPMARAKFGPDVRYGGPGWAGISYGHVNCLGSELVFPPDSEVAHTPIYGSLQEGIDALQRETNWADAGMMPFHLGLWDELRKRFPDLDISFGGFGLEGPVTTGWELRGHGFFTDLHDDPPLCHEYLRLVTDSIVDYGAFLSSVNGQPASSETGVGLYDDVASLLSPDVWPEMVVPFCERYFAQRTSGRRHAHIENLVPAHLPFLDVLRLDSFDPSVSPKLTPQDVRDGCHVPFYWRLNSMQLRDMEPDAIRRFVLDSVADGASGVFLALSRTTLGEGAVTKVHAFMDTARQMEDHLAQGLGRESLEAHS